MMYPILIVDDNRLITEILTKLLHSAGYEVSIAHSGKEAMRKLNLKKKPKVILLDIGMSSMDGYEVAKNIRANKDFSDIILVAFTGRARMQDKLKARAAGFDHYISKTASMAEIKMILNAYDY